MKGSHYRNAMTKAKQPYHEIISPEKVYSRSDILVRKNCPVPKEEGLYGWYFRNLPSIIPMKGCLKFNDLTLLYVGISPKAPPKNGKTPSRENLYKRIRYHMRGNAEGSTLRLTLGCLLKDNLEIELRRVGSGKRMTFTDGEAKLSEWMEDNAFVVWANNPEAWILEEELITKLSLPLNLKGNENHKFYATLSKLRKEARERAKKLAVWHR